MKDLNDLKEHLKDFNSATKEFDELYHLIANKHNISDSAFWILYEIRLNDSPLTQSKLCKSVFLPKQTINSSLKILEEGDILSLVSSTDNKKNKLIILTPKGVSLAEKIIDDVIKAELKTLDTIDENELAIFLKVYHKYLQSLKEGTLDKHEN